MRPKQESFTDAEFEKYRKRTRRDQFLSEMQAVVPWSELLKLIEPMYPPGTGAGRPPLGLKRMLRVHFLQHWFNLSDPAVEEALDPGHRERPSGRAGLSGQHRYHRRCDDHPCAVLDEEPRG